MPFDYSATEFRDILEEISRRNLEIQKIHLPYGRYSRSLGNMGCHFSTKTEAVQDSGHGSLPSSHMVIEDMQMKAARDALIMQLRGYLMRMGCMHEGHSRVVVSFGLTDAGNAAILVRLDGIPVHERAVTPRTLSPKLRELAQRLSAYSEVSDPSDPVRRFILSHTDRIAAISPSQAMWKWLCLRHPRHAMALLDVPMEGGLEVSDSLHLILKQTPVYEVFEPGPTIAGALGVPCPELIRSIHHHVW
jgi:hypothetical protein